MLPRLFLQRLRISQAGTEATEPARGHLHQPLHGEYPGAAWGGAWPLPPGLRDRILAGEEGEVGWNSGPFLMKFCLVQPRDEWGG